MPDPPSPEPVTPGASASRSFTSGSSRSEKAVRDYLAWVEDPSSVVDGAGVACADEAFARATDSIDKLRAAAKRDRARRGDVQALTAGFVDHAKGYADADGIPVEAFRALGVDDDVLRRAGFHVPPGRGRGPAAPGRSPSGTRGVSTSRAVLLPAGRLKEVAVGLQGRFTLSQLADAAGGGSPATLRKAMEELIDEGRAAKLGPDPDHRGAGRPPTVYELR